MDEVLKIGVFAIIVLVSYNVGKHSRPEPPEPFVPPNYFIKETVAEKFCKDEFDNSILKERVRQAVTEIK